MSSCPSRTELEDLIAGRLVADRHRALDEHVTTCATCQATLDTLGEPQDAFLSAVEELASLAVHSASPPLQQAIERIKLLPDVSEPVPSAPESSPVVDHLLGDFRIVRQVGRGGMGVVYEAEQISLGRKVALKTLPFAGLLDPRRLQRFQNEARAAASLEHPHIVPVYAVGVDRGVYFYAMRFIDGPNLSEIIDELQRRLRPTAAAARSKATTTVTVRPHVKAGAAAQKRDENGAAAAPRRNGSSVPESNENESGDPDSDSLQIWAEGTSPIAGDPTDAGPDPLGTADGSELSGPRHIRRVVRFVIEAARALDYAHERGVVHRDIKPSNLMLDSKGALWITDFGLARIEADPTLSATGEVMGTLRYMSPEQALGKRGVVDHRSDIYSLGVTLYELLTLTSIFPDEPDPVVLAKIAAEDPTPPRQLNPSIPVDLETIVLKAMSKEASERYATAEEFAADLEHFCNHQRIKAQRPRAADRLARWLRRHPAGLAMVATAVVALGVMAAGFATYSAVLSRTIRERDESNARLNDTNARLNTANIETANALRQSKEAGERADRALQESRQQVYAQDIERAARAGATEDVNLASNLLARHVPQNGQSDLRGFEWYWLRSHLIGTGPTLRVSQKPVYDAEYSPDGLRIATGGADAYLSVFDAKSGERILHVPTGQIEVNAAAFSPDGKTIATTGDDSTIRLWDARDGKPGLCLHGPQGKHAFSVLFTPDGRNLVTTGNEPYIRIWNARSGALEAEIKDSKDAVNQIALSADGKTLASANDDSAARLWDLATRKCLRVLPVNEGRCLAVAFSRDGNLLVTGHGDRTVRIWKCSDGTTALVGRLRDPLKDACFLPTGEGILAADGAGSVRVWAIPHQFEPPESRNLAAVTSISDGRSDDSLARWKRHAGIIYRITASRARNAVASAGNDGTVSITELVSGIERPTVHWQSLWIVSLFHFSPHDEVLWTDRATDRDGDTPGGNAALYNLQTNVEEHWGREKAWHLFSIALPPDEREVLTGHANGKIQIHHRSLPGPGAISGPKGDQHPVFRPVDAPGPGAISGVKGDQHPLFRRVEPPAPGTIWKLNAEAIVDQMEFLPDGRTLIVFLGEGPDRLRFYDYPTRQRLDRYPTRPVGQPLVLSHSGRWLAARGDRIVYIWDLRTPPFSIREFAVTYDIHALAVSPDERLLASGGEDRKIALRSLPTGAIQHELIGHQAFVTALAFSPDGRTLLSGDLSGAIKVWSVQSGRFLCDLSHDIRKIQRIEFSPSGRYLAYSVYHGPINVFDLRKLKTDD